MKTYLSDDGKYVSEKPEFYVLGYDINGERILNNSLIFTFYGEFEKPNDFTGIYTLNNSVVTNQDEYKRFFRFLFKSYSQNVPKINIGDIVSYDFGNYQEKFVVTNIFNHLFIEIKKAYGIEGRGKGKYVPIFRLKKIDI